jgi:hypothetical protein
LEQDFLQDRADLQERLQIGRLDDIAGNPQRLSLRRSGGEADELAMTTGMPAKRAVPRIASST